MVVPGIWTTEQLWVALPERCPGVRRDGGKELTQRDGESLALSVRANTSTWPTNSLLSAMVVYLRIGVPDRLHDRGVC